MSKIYNSRFSSGFSLIDILLTMFLIVIFTSILFVSSGSYITSRKATLRIQAAKAASERIDYLRNQARINFPSITTQSFTSPEIQKLPSGTGNQTINNYQGQTDIKLVTVTVSWVEQNVSKSEQFETIIYQYGLN